jgi:hypothetical protein
MHAHHSACLCAVYTGTAPCTTPTSSLTSRRRSHTPMPDQPCPLLSHTGHTCAPPSPSHHPLHPFMPSTHHQPHPDPHPTRTALQATHPIEKPETPPPSRTTTVHPKQPRSGNMPLHAPAPSHRTISSASHGHQHRSGDVSTTTGPVTTTTTTTTTTIGPVTTTATTIGPVTTTTTTTIGPVTTSTPCLPMPDLGCKADNASVVDYKPLPSDQPPAGLAGITMLHLAEPAPLAGQGCEVPAFDPMAQELQAALEEVFGDWDIPAAGMWVQQAGGSWLQPCEMEEAKPGSPVTLLGKRKRGYEDGRCLGFC